MRALRWTGNDVELFWMFGSPEQQDYAWLSMFQAIEREEYYTIGLTGEQKILYDRAREGNPDAARRLIYLRDDAEYEDFDFVEINEKELS